MALRIYLQPKDTTKFSINGEHTAPFSVAIDGRASGAIEYQLYLRNDDIEYWYTDISVRPVGTATWPVDGTRGYSWKLKEGFIKPTQKEWDMIESGNSITFSDIGVSSYGDIVSYLPFWVRVEIPKADKAYTVKDITIQIRFTESAV